MRNLLELLNDYVRLKEAEAVKAALATSNPLAARVLAVLDQEAGVVQHHHNQESTAHGVLATAQQQRWQRQAAAPAAEVQWVPQPPAAGAPHSQVEQRMGQAATYAGGAAARGGDAMAATPGRHRKGAPRKRQRCVELAAGTDRAAAGPDAAALPALPQFGGCSGEGAGWGSPLDLLNLQLDASALELLLDDGPLQVGKNRLLACRSMPISASAPQRRKRPCTCFPDHSSWQERQDVPARAPELHVLQAPFSHICSILMRAAATPLTVACAATNPSLPSSVLLQVAFAEHLAQHINTTGVADPQEVLAELPSDPVMAEVLQQVVRPGTASPQPPSVAATAPGRRAPSRGAGSWRVPHAGRWSQQAVDRQHAEALDQPVLPIVSPQLPLLRQQEDELQQEEAEQQHQKQEQRQQPEQQQEEERQQRLRYATVQQPRLSVQSQSQQADMATGEHEQAGRPEVQLPATKRAQQHTVQAPPDASEASAAGGRPASSEQAAACVQVPLVGAVSLVQSAQAPCLPCQPDELAVQGEPVMQGSAAAASKQTADCTQPAAKDEARAQTAASSAAASQQQAACAPAAAAEAPATRVGLNRPEHCQQEAADQVMSRQQHAYSLPGHGEASQRQVGSGRLALLAAWVRAEVAACGVKGSPAILDCTFADLQHAGTSGRF